MIRDRQGGAASGLRRFWLTGRWGVAAAVALAVAALAAGTDAGETRIAGALATLRGEPAPPTVAETERAAYAAEARRFADAIRTLAADRDRLATRVATLERNLEDVTGSIARLPAPAPAAIATPAPALATPPDPVAPGFVLLEPALGLDRAPVTPESSEALWSNVPMPRPAPRPQALHTGSVPSHQQDAADEPAPRRTQYGVDLGGASTIEGIRAIWMAQRGKIPALGTLTPAVGRSGQRAGPTQLRLVAGPLPNAASAAQLCQALTAQRILCQPTVYDGQPLALR